MEWFAKRQMRSADRESHIALLEQLQKQNERWWVTVLKTFFFGLMLLPIKTEWFSTAKLIAGIAGAASYLLTTIVTVLHLAPLTRWRRLSAAVSSVGVVWIVIPVYLLLFDRTGNRENMYRLLGCAPFIWLLFAYCRLRIRRIRRESAEEIDRLRQAERRRKRLEML